MALSCCGRVRGQTLALALAVASVLVAASCSAVGSESSAPTTTAPPVEVTAVPVAGAADVPPDQVVSITVASGTIGSIQIAPAGTTPTSSAGDTGTSAASDTTAADDAGTIMGTLSSDATSWQSTSPLVPSTTYAVNASFLDIFGGTQSQQWQFTTGAPSKVFRAILSPGDNKVVGVGMPVQVKLNTPMPKARHAEFEKLLTVESTPTVVGAWHWFSDTELHWRPKDFWPAGTKVSVTAKIAGFAAGDGAYGAKDVNVKYSIGPSHVSIVDVNAHTMTVFDGAQIAKVIKVSTGRDEFPTHGGIHVASEKENPKIMDSSTIGIPRDGPGGYYESVPYSVRISNSGEFVHAASWSTGAQGNSNVSHGCVNVSPTDGQWFYDFTQLGDVVQVNGSPVQLQPTNGIGDWQIPWAEWPN